MSKLYVKRFNRVFANFISDIHKQELSLGTRNIDGMKRETLLDAWIVMLAIAISLLATKINVVLEININSSSTDRGEGTSDFKTLSEFYQ